MACTLRLKHHVHDKLTGLRRVCLGIGSFVCITNLLITQCLDEDGQRN